MRTINIIESYGSGIDLKVELLQPCEDNNYTQRYILSLDGDRMSIYFDTRDEALKEFKRLEKKYLAELRA